MKWSVFAAFCALFASVAAAPTIVQHVEKDPELTAGYFEGDMVLDTERSGHKSELRRWPNGVVYYKFLEGYFDDHHKNHILLGMHIIEVNSCIHFEEASPEQKNYVEIAGESNGCSSSVGYWNRKQKYNLQIFPLDKGCFRLGTIVHEFLHILGFFHMQSSSDRDDYVHIAAENIQPGREHNFNKRDNNTSDTFDEEYDYASIMHYSAYAFSSNGEKTIIALEQESADKMGQRQRLTKRDINRLNVMYRCPRGI